MEPIFTETASETVTAKLAAQLANAIAALPPPIALTPSNESRLSWEKLHLYGSKTRPSRKVSP